MEPRSRRWRRPATSIAIFLLVSIGILTLYRYQSANVESGSQPAAAQRIVDLTNAARAAHSLAPVSLDRGLTLAAEEYSQAMAERDWFSHAGPDGSTIDLRIQAAGYRGWTYLGENLARGYGPMDPSDIVDGWMNSAAHRDNILSSNLREIGVGCYVRSDPDLRFWCVQDFGARGRQLLGVSRLHNGPDG
ncbi:MAG: CAP domain-containing protein [Dehalococcoidia bacterium]|nr:CAP domain-containing protein [Dehalococcoidia bacterium]